MRFNLRQRLIPRGEPETIIQHYGDHGVGGGGATFLLPKGLSKGIGGGGGGGAGTDIASKTTGHWSGVWTSSSDGSASSSQQQQHYHHHHNRLCAASKAASLQSEWDVQTLEAEVEHHHQQEQLQQHEDEVPETQESFDEHIVIVPAYDPYQPSEHNSGVMNMDGNGSSSLGEVIRKVALLRTPLNYDDPDKTSRKRLRKWLKASLEAIELSRMGDMVLQEVDDAYRDPPPEDVDAWQQQRHQQQQPPHDDDEEEEEEEEHFNTPVTNEPSTPRERVAVPTAPIKTPVPTRAKRTKKEIIRKVEKPRTPPPQPQRQQRVNQNNTIASEITIDDSYQHRSSPPKEHPYETVAEMMAPKCHTTGSGSGGQEVSHQVDGILKILEGGEESGVEKQRRHNQRRVQATTPARERPTIATQETSVDDDISVSSMEYLFNWLTCTDVEEVFNAKKCIGDDSGFSMTKASKQTSRQVKKKAALQEASPKKSRRKYLQPRGRSKSPMKKRQIVYRNAEVPRSKTPKKQQQQHSESRADETLADRQTMLRVRSQSAQKDRMNNFLDLPQVALPSMDGGDAVGPVVPENVRQSDNDHRTKRIPNVTPETPRFRSILRGLGRGRAAEGARSRSRSRKR